MENKHAVIGFMISLGFIFTFVILYADPISQAFGGVTLNPTDAAKSIQVRIKPATSNTEYTYNSFSRIGFVAGEANFLLESVPSKDKNSFYKLVKSSLEDRDGLLRSSNLDVSMDIFSGDGKIIETLVYKKCEVTEYFVHVVDSKGTIFFLKDDGSVEIREVTKFACSSFSLDLTKAENNDFEGDVHFNTSTNTWQKYVNGEWTNMSSTDISRSLKK